MARLLSRLEAFLPVVLFIICLLKFRNQFTENHRMKCGIPILIDGNAFAHRWYHRWAFANKLAVEAAANPAAVKKSVRRSDINDKYIRDVKAKDSVDPRNFAFNNARSLVATSQSFTLQDLRNGAMPQYPFTYKTLGTERPNKMIVCFDHGDAGRTKMYPGYKQARRERVKPLELKLFFDEMSSVFQSQPMRSALLLPGFRSADVDRETFHKEISSLFPGLDAEADDMLATISIELAKKKMPHVVMTHDFDAMHVVRDDVPVCMYDPKTKELLNAAAVEKRIGVPPSDVVSYKILVGDASDEIPGVKTLGPKRAAALIKKYGTIEAILARGPQEETGKTMKKVLSEAAPDVTLSRRLVEHRHCDAVLMPTVWKFLSSS